MKDLREALARIIDQKAFKGGAHPGQVESAYRGNAYLKAGRILDVLKDRGVLLREIPHLGVCT